MNIRSIFAKLLFAIVLWGGMAIGNGTYGAGIDLGKKGDYYGIVSQVQMELGKTFTGFMYVVDSGHTLARDAASSGNFKSPYATLDYAIGRAGTPSATGANNGNLILVLPGHAETLIADSTGGAGVDVDVAGLTIVGVGDGEARPIFTFATAAAADFKLAAANLTIHNLVFKCNIASQAMMIETSGDDIEISHCEFREGTATGLTFISVGLADGDSDRAWIHDCTFQATTAGNYTNAITVLFDMNGIIIENNHIHGDFDVAGIGIPTAGNAQVDILIQNDDITNLLTGQFAIEIIGTASTGKIIDCNVQTDAIATAIDAGGLEMYNCLFNIGTDQGGWTPVVVEPDSTANILGADDANNDFASTSVASNRDGSVLERLEAVQGDLVDDVSTNILGFDDANNVAATSSVVANRDGSIIERLEDIESLQERTVVSSTAVMVNNDDVFTVSGGLILVTSLLSVCITDNDGTASTLQYELDPTLGSAVTVSGASASLASVTAGACVSFQGTAVSTAPIVVASHGNIGMQNAGLIVGPGVISLVVGVGSTTGTWKHYISYRPLEAAGTIVGI